MQYFSFLRGEKNLVIAHRIKYVLVTASQFIKQFSENAPNARVQIAALALLPSHVGA